MGAIISSRQYFLDSLIELVGIKSGLGIADSDAVALLDESEASTGWWRGDATEGIRLRFEELEFTFAELLFRVGATADPRIPLQLMLEFCRDFRAPVDWRVLHPDVSDDELEEDPSETPPQIIATNYLRAIFTAYLDGAISLPAALGSLPGMDQLIEQYRLRSVHDYSMPTNRDWDGIVPLSELFESEAAPTKPNSFIDQRFIDYLHAQPGDLAKMNWRKFEALAAEFFSRQGYSVTLGPGRGDGGKDVAAMKVDNVVGPELVYVQCKRLDTKYEVDIDVVKAFWTTLSDDKATRGIIATTSRLAAGAREYCDARKYQLKAAEASHVHEWIVNMSKHHNPTSGADAT